MGRQQPDFKKKLRIVMLNKTQREVKRRGAMDKAWLPNPFQFKYINIQGDCKALLSTVLFYNSGHFFVRN
jgi:hypothetical protein